MGVLTRSSSKLAFAIAFGLLSSAPIAAQGSVLDGPVIDPETPFVVCHDQRYALCATAQCFVYGQVAYCECDMLKGDSISLQDSFTTPAGERNVCSVNAEGQFNGYKVSTYSFPADVAAGGPVAEYTCPGADNADGGVAAPVAYAQCDGGICFQSTVARRFPGFPERLQVNEIMCSCPIATGSTPGSANSLGYQISGPYHPSAPAGQKCDQSTCALCSVKNPLANGATLRVGAATGVPDFLTIRLYGPPLPISNECQCKCEKGTDGTTSCSVADDASS